MDLHQWLIDRYQVNTEKLPYVISGVNRDNLALWFNEWGFTKGVEVGTFRGVYAEILCQNNPNLHLTCVDAWKIYPGYADYKLQSTLDDAYRKSKERLSKYNCSLIQGYSEPIANQFTDETFDFVYIDGNHELKWAIQDLYAWIPKVKRGGVISGHDYLWSEPFPNLQVIEAVNAYTSANRIKKWYVLGRQRKPTLDLRKISGYARSWMWLKE